MQESKQGFLNIVSLVKHGVNSFCVSIHFSYCTLINAKKTKCNVHCSSLNLSFVSLTVTEISHYTDM